MSAERKVFGRLQGMAETPPDLIEIQTKSYEDFLQADVAPQKRENKGLQAIFKEIFPVVSQDARYSLDFVGYNLGEPKKSYLQALLDGETYARPLFATFRLNDAGEVREEEVFLGDMPMMPVLPHICNSGTLYHFPVPSVITRAIPRCTTSKCFASIVV